MSGNFKNILFAGISMLLFTALLLIVLTASGSEITAQSQDKNDNSVYGVGISPSLEGISLRDDSDIVKSKLDSRRIFGRYIDRTNHTTFIDPYLIYSQRFYTQYYSDFVPTTLCDGKEYLIKFNDININNLAYQMYRESSGNYYVVYNKLFGLSMKNEETLRRLNPDLDRKSGISIDFYKNKVYSITANYSLNLDKIKKMVEEYNFIYGKYNEISQGDIITLRWSENNNIITISSSKEIIDNLSFIDLHREDKEFNNNLIKVKLYNSSVRRDIVNYKSEIYMDIVRSLSYDYKNKVDTMNRYICEVKR